MKEAKYQQNAVFHLSHKQKGKQQDLVLAMCEMDLEDSQIGLERAHF